MPAISLAFLILQHFVSVWELIFGNSFYNALQHYQRNLPLKLYASKTYGLDCVVRQSVTFCIFRSKESQREPKKL